MENNEEVVVVTRPTVHVPDIVDPADELICDSCQ